MLFPQKKLFLFVLGFNGGLELFVNYSVGFDATMLATQGDDANTVETDTTILKSVSIVVGNLNILPPVFDSVKTVTLFEETTPMIQVRVFTNYSTVTFSLFLQFIGESELRPPSPARLRSRSLPQKRADPVIACPLPAATALNEIVFQGMSS